MEPEAGVRKVQKKKTFSICKATEERGELYLVTSVLKTKQNLKYLITIHSSRLSSDTKVHDISAYCDIYSGG